MKSIKYIKFTTLTDLFIRKITNNLNSLSFISINFIISYHLMNTIYDNGMQKIGYFKTMTEHKEEVVISGIGGLFPECNNVDELKNLLFNKINGVTVDSRRWNLSIKIICIM